MKLHALGRPRVIDSGKELTLQPLPMTVLVYLAIGGPRDRSHLAELFWSNSNNSLNSLSSTLNRIRAEVPGAIWTDGPSQVGSDLLTDVGQLLSAADAGDVALVAELYDAPFLSGSTLRRYSVEFEEWMFGWRSSVAATVELSLLQHGRALLDAGQYVEAAQAAAKAWKISTEHGVPSPDLFPAYHHMLALAGNPTAQAIRSMADEFGIELQAVEPVALGVPPGTPAPVGHSSDTVTSGATLPIFGCYDEQQLIVSSVESTDVTTLLGLGGSGKTLLASNYYLSQAARDRFDHRHWVSLREIKDPALLGPTIAAGIGVRFTPDQPIAAQLPNDESSLIVLDNFDHLIGESMAVEELVAHADNVHVLVTSRIPLGLTNESLIHLTGLAISDDESASPAIQLFESAARRAGASEDRLGGMHRVAIREVCRKLGGHPLAIELAGAWAPLLSASEIGEALVHSSELLDSEGIGSSRSMNLVLEESWMTLADEDQRTLMLLATFLAGCATSEIVRMPELPMASIRRLTQCSMVSMRVQGRAALHPLIADFATKKLAGRPNVETELRQVHADWCCEFVRTTQTNLLSGGNSYSNALESELVNVTAAWAWGARQGTWHVHQSTVAALREFFAESGRVVEGRMLLESTITALRSTSDPPVDLLPEMLETLAWLEVLAGQTELADDLLREAPSSCSEKHVAMRAQILRTMGLIDLGAGRTDEAATRFEEALQLLATHELIPLLGKLQHDLGQAHHFNGQLDDARHSFRAALDIGRTANDPLMIARSYLCLGQLETEEHPTRALILLEEGRQIAEEHGLDHIGSYFPSMLGLVHLDLKDPDTAQGCFELGIEESTKVRHPIQVCANYIGLALSHLGLNRVAAAIDDLQTATRLARETNCWPYIMWASIVSARAADAAGVAHPLGLDLLELARTHPSTHEQNRDDASAAIIDIYGSQSVCEPASDEPDDVRLDEVAERILELLSVARNGLRH